MISGDINPNVQVTKPHYTNDQNGQISYNKLLPYLYCPLQNQFYVMNLQRRFSINPISQPIRKFYRKHQIQTDEKKKSTVKKALEDLKRA